MLLPTAFSCNELLSVSAICYQRSSNHVTSLMKTPLPLIRLLGMILLTGHALAAFLGSFLKNCLAEYSLYKIALSSKVLRGNKVNRTEF